MMINLVYLASDKRKEFRETQSEEMKSYISKSKSTLMSKKLYDGDKPNRFRKARRSITQIEMNKNISSIV